jgi:hypothetical protein
MALHGFMSFAKASELHWLTEVGPMLLLKMVWGFLWRLYDLGWLSSYKFIFHFRQGPQMNSTSKRFLAENEN